MSLHPRAVGRCVRNCKYTMKCSKNGIDNTYRCLHGPVRHLIFSETAATKLIKQLFNPHSVVPIQLGPPGFGQLTRCCNDQRHCRNKRHDLPVAPTFGIGTTTPVMALDVSGSSATSNGIGLRLFNGNGTNTNQWYVGTGGNTVAASAFSIGDNSAYRLVINNSGNVGIGTTAPAAALDVTGASPTPLRLRNTSSSAGKFWVQGPDSINSFVIYNQSNVGMFMVDGATTWSANSDVRVKKNFLPISDALDKTLQLRGLTYHYKTDADNDPRRVGVIAQDVQRVLPEAVTERDGILAVKYTEIIPLVIEAIKEMKRGLDLKLASLVKQSTETNEEISALRARADKAEAESAQLKAALCSKFSDLPVCVSNVDE